MSNKITGMEKFSGKSGEPCFLVKTITHLPLFGEVVKDYRFSNYDVILTAMKKVINSDKVIEERPHSFTVDEDGNALNDGFYSSMYIGKKINGNSVSYYIRIENEGSFNSIMAYVFDIDFTTEFLSEEIASELWNNR